MYVISKIWLCESGQEVLAGTCWGGGAGTVFFCVTPNRCVYEVIVRCGQLQHAASQFVFGLQTKDVA